jgi:hypothetical protein
MRRLLVLTCLFVVATAMPAAAVLPVPTLDVEPLSTVATEGSSITVAGHVTDPASTPDLPIVVSRSSDGSTWTDATGSPTTTAADGSFSVSDTVPPQGEYTYRASWVGDGSTYDYGEALSTTTLTSLPTSTLEIEPDVTSSHVGETVGISGTLTDPPDIENASIVITRSSDGATYNAIADSPVLTDASGGFTASDAPDQPGTYTYRAAWDGDGAMYGSGAAISSTSLTVTYTASLTVQASASKIVYGDSVKVKGTWNSPSGGVPTNTDVAITRTKAGGGTVGKTATLTASNTYRIVDTPPSTGSFNYAVDWSGDDTHDAAAQQSVDVSVTKRSTALSLSLSHGTVVFGDATRLVATLKRGDPNSKVRFEKRAGGSWQAIGTVAVDKDGIAKLKVSPQEKKTYRAVFAATNNLKSSTSSTVTVKVRPIMVSRMTGTFTKVKGYAVYGCCTAYFYVKLKPIHPRLSWTATVQYYGNGSWRKLGSQQYRFQADGGSTIYLTASSGYRYRVRGHFDGDGNHLPATSAWRYFRFSK